MKGGSVRNFFCVICLLCVFLVQPALGDQSCVAPGYGCSGNQVVEHFWYWEGGALYSATLRYAAGGEPQPLIIITNGFLGSKESIEWIAKVLPDYATLTFTPPNIVSSDQTLWARGFLGAIDLAGELAVDSSRIGLIGNSMGGGGCIEASAASDAVIASVALAPAGSDDGWAAAAMIDHPTLILTGDNDRIVPSAGPLRYYETLPVEVEKVYLQLRGVNHQANMDLFWAHLGMLITDDGPCELGVRGQHELLAFYFRNWFDFYLKGEGSALDFSSLDDPEVVSDYRLSL